MFKLDIKKAFNQLYSSKVAPALETVGVALGLMRQMTGAKVRWVPMAGQSLFVLGLALIQIWYDQKFCVDIGGKPLAARGSVSA